MTPNIFQVLHKVRSIGSDRVLVHFEPFLMSLSASAVVFTITQALVLFSSFVLYHYGWTKFQHFIASEKEKYHIMSKHGYEVNNPILMLDYIKTREIIFVRSNNLLFY